MFCFQCEETVERNGCTKIGICGKTDEVSNLQDLLIYNLKGAAFWMAAVKQGGGTIEDADYTIMLKDLFSTVTNVNFDPDAMKALLDESLKIRDKYKKSYSGNEIGFIPDCAVWEPIDASLAEYNQKAVTVGITNREDDIVSLKELLTYGLKGMAAYAYHAHVLNYTDSSISEFTVKALNYLNAKDVSMNDTLNLVFECGEKGVKAMELLDKANTSHYGDPEPTQVLNGTKKGKAILISGHDLYELEELLEQTKNTGISVYTHGEMLPAHAYPFFKKYKNLVGNFGGAWWEQQTEFENFGGAIVMTTNCIQKPTEKYRDRIFTTDLVAMPGVKHIENYNFSEVIKMALAMDGTEEDIKGEITTGFARNTLVKSADAIIDLIKNNKIKNFVVMAGCDGRDKGRNYYTELAQNLPGDSVILTAGCAKYRYNRLDLGSIEGLPRVIDAGQCNDSYSLVAVALKLKEALNLDDINDLPIFYEIAWYEQKAVLVLLALLYLGVRNIRLGVNLPAFLSQNVLNLLVEKFHVMGVSSVKESIDYIKGE